MAMKISDLYDEAKERGLTVHPCMLSDDTMCAFHLDLPQHNCLAIDRRQGWFDIRAVLNDDRRSYCSIVLFDHLTAEAVIAILQVAATNEDNQPKEAQ